MAQAAPDALGIVQGLQANLDALWAEIMAVEARDLAAGTFSSERFSLLRRIRALIKARQLALAEQKRSRRNPSASQRQSLASVYEDEDENEDGRMQACVFVRCETAGTGYEVGPVWGTGPRSVARALRTLTEQCDCGASFHNEA